jgi:hypothetical protein
MGIIDAFLVYKFIRLLVTPFDHTDAFKLGVIDARGKYLKKGSHLTIEQSKSYTLFHRLVFNIKKLIELVPGGKSKLGTYAAALFLLRENLDNEGKLILDRCFMDYLKEEDCVDETFLEEKYLPEEILPQGNYKLIDDMLDIKGNSIAKNALVVAKTDLKPLARILGVDVYQLWVGYTGKAVVVSKDDIKEID